MQNDDVTWGIINRGHCSYKIKTTTQHFCRNEFSVSGLCNRKSCPLANSQYATVREHKGMVYLYVRMAEKVYTPCEQWKKIKLSKEFVTSLQQIEDNLVFWPQFFKRKCRQRFLKITQYISRMRTLKLHDNKVIVPVRRKEERRFARKEEKALIAAKMDTAIETQLLERLKSGTYQQIYNFPKKAFDLRLEKEILEEEERDEMLEGEEEEDEELEDEEELQEVKDEEMDAHLVQELERGVVRIQRQESDSDDDDEDDEEEDGHVEYVGDFDESDDEDEDIPDIEDAAERLPRAPVAGPSRGRAAAVAAGNSSDEEDYSKQDKIRSKKYAPKKHVPASKKYAEKKAMAKQQIRAIYEKEKAAKESKRIKVTRK